MISLGLTMVGNGGIRILRRQRIGDSNFDGSSACHIMLDTYNRLLFGKYAGENFTMASIVFARLQYRYTLGHVCAVTLSVWCLLDMRSIVQVVNILTRFRVQHCTTTSQDIVIELHHQRRPWFFKRRALASQQCTLKHV